jgi:hypothetical protein
MNERAEASVRERAVEPGRGWREMAGKPRDLRTHR